MTTASSTVFGSDVIDRIAPTRRPNDRVIGYHTWTDLLFAHWRVPADLLRPLIPDRLELDTFDGDAWLGMVPFHIRGLRLSWLPAVPGLSEFHETNLRTYVHFKGRDPGVWFFSLDAANWPAVEVARWKWHLNYYHATMDVVRREDRIWYRSRRRDHRSAIRAEVEVDAAIGDPLLAATETSVAPGTLEHFLAERYFLYAADARGGLYSGRVWHRPYRVRSAEVLHCRESLSESIGVTPSGPPEHALFCDGVDVEVFPLRPLTAG